MNIDITDYIYEGRDNAISRKSLVECTGLPDRSVRRLIAKARAEGHAIVGDPNGGYYLAETEDDINLLLGELRSRMGKLAQCYRAVKAKGLAS